MKKICVLLLALSCATFSLIAQATSHVEGDVLVRLYDNADLKALVNDFQTLNGQPTNLEINRQVSKNLNIWLLHFSPSIPHRALLDALYTDKRVQEVQLNHYIEWRGTFPNDPQLTQQWQYLNTGQSGGTAGADLDAELAWDVTTGGTTPLGDTIVVAVIDDGCVAHPDFGDNLWVNRLEMPNNNIDDDGNGFVDDYFGWNVHQDNDNVFTGGGHGTPVAGIVGAQGDNGVGVSGVNWNVKLMIIRLVTTVEADVIEAYDYVLQNRKIYNETNGTAGAFVVATNSSWGINNGQPSQAPLWCAFYDSLGVNGILSAGATANANFNIDQTGDLPTACPSDYLISVTNINDDDQKVGQAGYGLTTIDLGAFGEGTVTLNSNGGYSGFGGTSGATPHVAGTVGLLYSVPCFSFAQLAKTHPDSAALLVKQYILNGTDFNTSLQGITVTGGRLNMNGAVQSLLNACVPSSGCVPPFALNLSSRTDTSATLTWGAFVDTLTTFTLAYRNVTDTVWTNISLTADTNFVFVLNGLVPCTNYEFKVEMDCDTAFSGFSAPFSFKTDGCCTSPALVLSAATDSSALLSWNSILAAQSYNLRFRAVGTTVWTTFNALNGTSLLLNNLDLCGSYEAQIQTNCQNDTTTFSAIFNFSTACGNCTALSYCASQGNSVDDEWIERVQFAGIDNISGVGTAGYTNFTNISTVVAIGQTYPIALTQGYAGQAYPEFFEVWIDFNQNGSFEPSESVYASGSTQTAPNTGTVAIPLSAQMGATRMRVSMRYNAAPTPCQTFNYGEVEDYCLTIIDTGVVIVCDAPVNLTPTNLTTTSATLTWQGSAFSTGYVLQYRESGAATWQTVNTTATSFNLTGLQGCTTYEWMAQAICGDSVSPFSQPHTFTTVCPCNPVTNIDTMNVSSNFANISWSPTAHNVSYTIRYRPQGQQNWLTETATDTFYTLTNLQPATNYQVRIVTNCTGGSTSTPSDVFVFYTDWTVQTQALPTSLTGVAVFPNPFEAGVQLQIAATQAQKITVTLHDLAGRQVLTARHFQINTGNNTIFVEADNLTAGAYLLKISAAQGSVTRLLMKN